MVDIAKMCLNKRLFITLEEAQQAIYRLRKKCNKPWSAYKCPICKGYHLTTTVKRSHKTNTQEFSQ